MNNAHSLWVQHFCFIVYRVSCAFARWLQRIGAWRTSEAVYRVLPMPLVRIGYGCWQRWYPEDFNAFIRSGQS